MGSLSLWGVRYIYGDRYLLYFYVIIIKPWEKLIALGRNQGLS